MLQYGPILAVYWTQRKQIQESEYFKQELSLDTNYSSRFAQYPHYPIACSFPHLNTVAHNCHGKSINLTAKRKTHSKQNNLTAQRKRLAAKRKTSRQNEKDSKQKENHTAKRKRLTAKFLWYREDILILISFAVRSLFFLLWGYSFAVRFFFLPWG